VGSLSQCCAADSTGTGGRGFPGSSERGKQQTFWLTSEWKGVALSPEGGRQTLTIIYICRNWDLLPGGGRKQEMYITAAEKGKASSLIVSLFLIQHKNETAGGTGRKRKRYHLTLC